jgi:hypothetical protein
MKELGMHRIRARSVPKILTADQQQQCVDVCIELRQLTNDETLYRVIIGDESWAYGYNPEANNNPPSGKTHVTMDKKV